ncbi:MAG: endonuclease III [Litorilinea sp.]
MKQDPQAKAEFVESRLLERYGPISWKPEGDPVAELIGTILSANTTGKNASVAFDALMTVFDYDWDRIRTAPPDAIIDSIRPAGMYHQKAPRIIAALERIYADRGDYSLDYVAKMDVDAGLDYLTGFPGVGHKTASIVLLFAFNKATFPVDTHIQRISQRLGISRAKADPTQVTRDWEPLVEPAHYYQLHIHLIRHGRETCTARSPKCEICPLQDACDYYRGRGAWQR